MDIQIVASQADTDLMETDADDFEHPEKVENPQKVPPDPPNMDPPNMFLYPPYTSVDLMCVRRSSRINQPPDYISIHY